VRSPRRRLEQTAGTESPFVLLQRPEAPLHYRLAGPIWSERITGDALLELGSGEAVDIETELLGFVNLDLDFSWYHQRFLPKLWLASLALLAALAADVIRSSVRCRRSPRCKRRSRSLRAAKWKLLCRRPGTTRSKASWRRSRTRWLRFASVTAGSCISRCTIR
jgi:hypothetical protein